nr:hypothetical protein [Paenibacillus sp. MER TA 81-3]
MRLLAKESCCASVMSTPFPGKDERIVYVRFRQPGDCTDRYQLRSLDPGVVYDGREHRLLLHGELHLALRQLSSHEIDDIRIDQPSLEQVVHGRV